MKHISREANEALERAKQALMEASLQLMNDDNPVIASKVDTLAGKVESIQHI
jgi:hypothetical protein